MRTDNTNFYFFYSTPPPTEEGKKKFHQKEKKRSLFILVKIVGFAAILLISVIETSIAADFKLKRSSGELCFSCHEEKRNTFDKMYVHSPVKQNNCIVCHNPHTSKHQFILSEAIPKLCYSCHDNERNIFGQASDTQSTVGKGSIHTAVGQGKCTGCHDPHASDNEHLRKKTDEELCYSCHQQEAEDFRGSQKIHLPVETGQCLNCHAPHISDFKAHLLDSLEQLCFTCHDQQDEEFKKAHGKYPIAKSYCLMCHTVHASSSRDPTLTKSLSLPYIHAPFGNKMCDTCHVSSDAPDPFKLRVTQTELCYRCHNEMKKEVESQVCVHLPVKDGLCSSCHEPHASKNKNLLAMTGEKLCANCHSDLMNKLKSQYAHSPVVQGNCVKCHQPHDSQNESLLVNDSIAVCTSCHEVQGKFTHPVGQGTIDPRTKKSVTCVSCHEAHGSEHEFILLEDRKRDLCIQCHKKM